MLLFGILVVFCVACTFAPKFKEPMENPLQEAPRTRAMTRYGDSADYVRDTKSYVGTHTETAPPAVMEAFHMNTPPETVCGVYGCCKNLNVAMVDEQGSNCSGYSPFGICPGTPYVKRDATGSNCPKTNGAFGKCPGSNRSCQDSKCSNCYGYCANGATYKNDAVGSNCPGMPSKNPWEALMCPDGVTIKTNPQGTNCPGMPSKNPWEALMCPDGVTIKTNPQGTNCPGMPSKNVWDELMCADGKTMKTSPEGYNCPGMPSKNPWEALMCPGSNVIKTDAEGTNCPKNEFGFCADGKTMKLNSAGTNCSPGLGNSFGLCSDGKTYKYNAEGTNCATYPVASPVEPPMWQQAQVAWKESAMPVQSVPNYGMGPGVSSYNTNTVFIPPPIGSGGSAGSFGSTSGSCPQPEPCPPCGRCPEPSFECKKVPNYASTNSEHLPMPVLSDFSTFGM